MKTLKRCKTKEGANVLLIDIEDDDDVIVVDTPGSSHFKKRESSEQRENQRVSPQSVIRIDDDDESESYTNLSAHGEECSTEFECDGTSNHRSDSLYDNPYDGISQHYQFGDDEYEYEPIDIDSDCEIMEDSSGELREHWEKAAAQRKAYRHKANFSPEDPEAASARNNSDVRKNNINEPLFEGPSCSKVNAPFDEEIPFTCNVTNEENHVPSDQNTLFPEFDWRNLGARSSFKKHISSDIRDGFTDNISNFFHGLFSESFPSQHNIGSTSFGSNGKDQNEQCRADSWEEEGTHRDNVISESHYVREMNINQTQFSTAHVRNTSNSYCENFTSERVECDCVFPGDCECGRSRDFGVEKVNKGEQLPSATLCKMKSNQSDVGFDSRRGDAPNHIPVNMDCETDCEKSVSEVTDEMLEKLPSSETEFRQDSFVQSKEPSVEIDPNNVQESGCSDPPVVEQSYGIDIINDKERLKETAEYKRVQEEELALRQQQLKLQAEEAQRLRKRKKAEQLRVSNIEKRQKLRLEEVRESQKQDSANLNMKEQLRSEVTKELKVLEMRCFDMATLLRRLGVQVDGGTHPSKQQIHGAYKRALLKFHPDRKSGSSLKQQVEAEEKFKLISRMKEKYKLG